jgi:type I restriction enzyme S subunit
LPGLDEQNRISKVVHSPVERIQKNKTYLRKLRRLKKGLMQDLLTGKVRTVDKAIAVLDEVAAHG